MGAWRRHRSSHRQCFAISSVPQPLRLIALPGTLLNEASVTPLLLATCAALRERGLIAQANVFILGEHDSMTDEINRIVGLAGAPCWWIGHSLGGIAALNIARLFPAAARGVVCIASTGRADASGNYAARHAQLSRAEADGHPLAVSLALKHDFGVEPGSELGQQLMAQAGAVGLVRFRNQTRYAIERPDQTSEPPLSMPLLAISGGLDEICPRDRSVEIARLSTRGKHICLDDATHLLPVTHAQQIAVLIADFINDATLAQTLVSPFQKDRPHAPIH